MIASLAIVVSGGLSIQTPGFRGFVVRAGRPSHKRFFATLTSERWRKAAYQRAVNQLSRHTSSNLQLKDKNVVAQHSQYVIRVYPMGTT
ncbi:MAG: hypothetical protein Hens2KO_03610 [Henriciella sp.]